MQSIKTRLTLVSMVVLSVFMVLTAVALERAVVKRAMQAEEDTLQLLIYSLLAAVDRDDDRGSITVASERLFEPSLVTRNSGLYALIYDAARREIWRSRSATVEFAAFDNLEIGRWSFETLEYQSKPYFRLGFGIQWPDADEKLQRYDVVIWRNAEEYFKQLARFRQTLWAWLIVTTLLLLLIMYLVTRWSLQPLRKIGLEVKAIEDQRQSAFEQSYPDEIAPLTENLNILLKREQYQRERYRNAMDDLAHSLKTPLAVLTALGDRDHLDSAQLETLREQTDRMNQIVSYQLQKATSMSNLRIARPVDLIGLIDKLMSALEKVYREKDVRVARDLPAHMFLRIDEGDCLEVVGNLLDNAFKYGRRRISITGGVETDGPPWIEIEDDGEGLDESEIEQILNRGTRLDEATEGQGIGLAVVADIVESYDIRMRFSRASIGGLRVRLEFQSI